MASAALDGALGEAAFLGVEQSLTGRRWIARPYDERLALTLCQRLGIPDLLARVLAGRGIGLDEAESFLDPKLNTLMPDPSRLRDMDAAAERVAAAVMGGETVAIFGDYDVDGATSSALLDRFLRAAGGRTLVYIPDRMTEGYGPNVPALLSLREQGCALVVTVDCGTTAFVPLAAATEAGLDVVVVDHHKPEAALPTALAVVNPNRLDEPPGLGHLAAVGVAFLLAVAVNRALRQAGWYKERREPDLKQWLDLVALGTVADVVKLTGLNRAFVVQGLKVLARRGNAGLAALADVAGVRERPEAYHLGYVLGPRVNAGGRVGESGMGARLLACDDPAAATAMAARLDGWNRERQELEAAVLLAAIEQVESAPDDGLPLVLAVGEGWHPGVIGIVASRLKERYNRPACAVSVIDGEAKGSARSVSGIDIGAAVIAATQAGILSKGGGHQMAAGFSLPATRLPDLRAFLAQHLADQLTGPLVPTMRLDGALDVGGATPALIERLAQAAPFGAGNAEPRFAITNARVMFPKVVGSGHVSCVLTGTGTARLKAIAFRCADSELGFALLRTGTPMHLAGTLRLDNWQGQTSVQLCIEDAAPA